MKKFIVINGSMGTGKSTLCKLLLRALSPSVYLDGDWCCNMNPFVVNEENKAMAIDNITHILNSYLNNSQLEYVIFCWVIHEESIYQEIFSRLSMTDYKLYKITLMCSESALRHRLTRDIEQGLRQADVVERSLERLPKYDSMSTIKLDVSHISPQQAAKKVCEIVKA